MDNGTNNKPFDWHSGRNTRVFLCGECDGHLSRMYSTKVKSFWSKKVMFVVFQSCRFQSSCCVPYDSLNWISTGNLGSPTKRKQRKHIIYRCHPVYSSQGHPFIPFKQIHGLRCQPKLSIQSSHAMYISMFKPFEETSATSIHRHLSWRTAKLRTTSLDCSCCKREGKECGSARCARL